jgi:hypothetical protein
MSLTGDGERWQSGQERHAENGEAVTEVELDLTPFGGSYCHVTVVDAAGKRA